MLTLTLDVPVRTTRSRESLCRAGRRVPSRLAHDAAAWLIWPGWLLALLQNSYPRFANIQPYAGPGASTNEIISFARKNMGGAFSWDEVKRYRDRWKRPMLVKGILHPDDAEKAVSLGVDGIWVSNHGGRQIEALPPSIDCCRRLSRRSASKATVLLDCGVRSGQDVMRALALGAKAAFAGKAFLWAARCAWR